MLKVGDEIEIGGKQVIVCYTANYNNENYICVAYETDKVEYNTYKYIEQDGKLLVSDDISDEDMKKVLGLFVEEGLEEYGLPEHIQEIVDNLPKIEE